MRKWLVDVQRVVTSHKVHEVWAESEKDAEAKAMKEAESDEEPDEAPDVEHEVLTTDEAEPDGV